MSVNKVNKTTGDLSLLAGGTLFADNPIGSIIPYGGATAPAGWFICDGTELVRATYPELFAVIGTSFGTPSDNTKFKLPDLREATTKGIGLTGKSNNHYDADGLALGEFIDDRLQDHEQELFNKSNQKLRVYPLQTSSGGTGVGVVSNAKEYTTITATTILTGRHGDTTEVKAVGVNYIIKAVSVGVPADFMSAVDEAVDEAISGLNTSGITESSALSNIGTAANATQHDVNVAIDSVIEDSVRYHTSHGTDLDTLIRPGIYSVEVLNTANQHAPTMGWMSIFISCWDHSVAYVQQLAFDVDGYIWFRMSNNTTWTSWRQLAFQS